METERQLANLIALANCLANTKTDQLVYQQEKSQNLSNADVNLKKDMINL